MNSRPGQPFVGTSAFAHKGGIHVTRCCKHPETYEHIEPERWATSGGCWCRSCRAAATSFTRPSERHRLDKNSPALREVVGRGEGAGEPGVRVRGGRGLLRAAAQESRGPLPALLRAGRAAADHRKGRLDGEPGGGGDDQGAGGRRGHPHGGGRATDRSTPWTTRCARRCGPLSRAGAASSWSTTRCGCWTKTAAPAPRCGCSSSAGDGGVGHGRRVHQHHRGQLAWRWSTASSTA